MLCVSQTGISFGKSRQKIFRPPRTASEAKPLNFARSKRFAPMTSLPGFSARKNRGNESETAAISRAAQVERVIPGKPKRKLRLKPSQSAFGPLQQLRLLCRRWGTFQIGRFSIFFLPISHRFIIIPDQVQKRYSECHPIFIHVFTRSNYLL